LLELGFNLCPLLSNMATSSATVSPETKRPESLTINGFRISTQKLPILKADPIEEMTQKLGIAPPEMIFGDNYVAIEHESGDWGINFNAYDALDKVDKTGQSMLQVAYSREWQKSRYGHSLVFPWEIWFPRGLKLTELQREDT
jgi:type 2A phosphatase activator TIP41